MVSVFQSHILDQQLCLLSVSKLTSENNAFVEFHRDFWCVRDSKTGMPLLQGELKSGLYQLPQGQSSSQEISQSQSKRSNFACSVSSQNVVVPRIESQNCFHCFQVSYD